MKTGRNWICPTRIRSGGCMREPEKFWRSTAAGSMKSPNYAREGYRCRHNLGYWTGREYLGLGLGASSLWRDTRFRNTDSMEEYLKDSGIFRKSAGKRKNFRLQDRQAEYMILGLRLTEGISLAGFRETLRNRCPKGLARSAGKIRGVRPAGRGCRKA